MSRPTYRIPNWSATFENSRSTSIKDTRWVPLPNRLDQLEYLTIVDHPNGAAHFGAWIALVQVASGCDKRGTLRRGAVSLGPRELSLVTHMPLSVFEEVIPRLLEVGWLEVADQETTCEPLPCVATALPRVATEGRKEWKEGNGKKEEAAAARARPLTAAKITSLFPSTDAQMVERIIAAAAAANPNLDDYSLAYKLEESRKNHPHQRSAALFLETLPIELGRQVVQ